jgi:hypothetical protein
MRIIAFPTDPEAVRAILARLGETSAPPRIEPALPPLWDLPDAGAGDFDPLHPAGTRVRVRSTHRLLTSTVPRPPRTTPDRRVPALAKRAIPAR